MPVVRHVTEEEIQAAADAEGYVVTFTKPHYHTDRQGFVVHSREWQEPTGHKGPDGKPSMRTHTREYKPNDCEEFRWILVGKYGDRKGFRYTTSSAMYDGNGDEIKAVPKVVTRPPLSKAHKKALLAGRKAARERKAAEAADEAGIIPKPRKVTVTKVAPEENELYKTGHYRVPCEMCGKGILRTGARGKPPKTHKDGCP